MKPNTLLVRTADVKPGWSREVVDRKEPLEPDSRWLSAIRVRCFHTAHQHNSAEPFPRSDADSAYGDGVDRRRLLRRDFRLPPCTGVTTSALHRSGRARGRRPRQQPSANTQALGVQRRTCERGQLSEPVSAATLSS